MVDGQGHSLKPSPGREQASYILFYVLVPARHDGKKGGRYVAFSYVLAATANSRNLGHTSLIHCSKHRRAANRKVSAFLVFLHILASLLPLPAFLFLPPHPRTESHVGAERPNNRLPFSSTGKGRPIIKRRCGLSSLASECSAILFFSSF